MKLLAWPRVVLANVGGCVLFATKTSGNALESNACPGCAWYVAAPATGRGRAVMEQNLIGLLQCARGDHQ